VFLIMAEGSPWLIGGWNRAELGSDFRHIDGDDITFDLAGGVGCRFNKESSLGFGAGGGSRALTVRPGISECSACGSRRGEIARHRPAI
jgi:hypothetical protein